MRSATRLSGRHPNGQKEGPVRKLLNSAIFTMITLRDLEGPLQDDCRGPLQGPFMEGLAMFDDSSVY